MEPSLKGGRKVVGKNGTDATRTNYTNGFAVQLKSGKAFDGEIAFANAVVRLVRFTVQRHNQR